MTGIVEPVASDWWKEFFHGLALDFWRAAMTDALTQNQADFLAKTLQAPAGGRILDVPCGNGRLSAALARRGYAMTGIDIAVEFIEEARTNAAVEWVCGDMRDLPGPATFDAAFCWGNSFGYLDDQGNIEFLRAVHRALKPGARFAIEAGAIAEALYPRLEAEATHRAGDVTMHIANSYDARRGRLDTQYVFVRGGDRQTCRSSQRVYSLRELADVMEAVGLEVGPAYGGLESEPFGVGSPQLILVARKP